MTKAGNISLLLADVDGTLVTHDKVLTTALDAPCGGCGRRESGSRYQRPSSEGDGDPDRAAAHRDTHRRFQWRAVRPSRPLHHGGEDTPPGRSWRAIDLILGHGLDVWVYAGDDWLVRDASAPHVDREAWTVKFPPKVVQDFNVVPNNVVKIVGVSDDHCLVERCEAEAQDSIGERATAARSQPYYLDVTHHDANKGFVADYLSRDPRHSAGRDRNDRRPAERVLMFRRSGFSIAMGNASDEVKRQASAVTESYDDEGFALAVERFILN